MGLWLLLFVLGVTSAPIDRPGATPDAPIVIGLHGRGDSPENFRGVADRLGPALHWQFLRGPLPWRPDLAGSQWFDRQVPDGGKAAMDAAVKLVDAQVTAAGKTPVALVGFSQGCMLASQYVAAHPDRVRAVLCFGGGFVLPAAVRPGKHKVQVRYVHGTADTMVPIQLARDAVATMQRGGVAATLTEHPGGHIIPPQLVPELRAWLERVVK